MIALVGLPGCGKSTVGRHLARRLQMQFEDSDQVIEQSLGCSIKNYFEREGEDRFREIEAEVIRQLLLLPLGVLSTGGGSVVCKKSREVLRTNCYVIYLHSTPDEVFKRLRYDHSRPLLQVVDPIGTLRDLYVARDPLYREVAHVVIETGRPSVSSLVNTIVAKLQSIGLVSQVVDGHQPGRD